MAKAKPKTRTKSPSSGKPLSATAPILSVGFDGLNSKHHRFPLANPEPILIRDEMEHALFQRCLELYRVMDLFCRKWPALVERYSKYHDRGQFSEALKFRHFDGSEAILVRLPPELLTRITSLFNQLHELSISLSYTEALPYTLRTELDETLARWRDQWDTLRTAVQARYGWDFLHLEQEA